MKRLVLILAVILSASLLFGQQNTFYAYQLKGNTVGDKVKAAQDLCALTPNMPCTIVIEPILASFATGSMPTKCAKCVWIDQRSSTGYFAGGSTGLPEAFEAQSAASSKAGKFSSVAVGATTVNRTGTIWTDGIGTGESMMTRLGYGALAAQTTGYSNTALGYLSLASLTTGTWNVSGGSRSMQYTTSGVSNVTLGTSAANANLTGSYNTAIGTNAQLINSTGSANTALGKDAQWSMNSASYNTGLGVNSQTCTTGSSNTAVGYRAMYGVTSNTGAIQYVSVGAGGSGYAIGDALTVTQGGASGGQVTVASVNGSGAVTGVTPRLAGTGYSVANVLATTGGTGSGATVNITMTQVVGSACAAAGDQGTYNVALGIQALEHNAGTGGNASSNTAVGASALNANTTGSSNTAQGNSALAASTTGNSNSAFGNGACGSNTTGSQNLCLGSNTDVASGNLNNTIAIGYGATVAASNTAQIGNAAMTDMYFGGASTAVHPAVMQVTKSVVSGGGHKHQRFGASCTTAASVGQTCTTTYSWASPFADGSYTPICTGVSGGGSPALTIDSFNASGVTVRILAVTANASTFSAVYCMADHD
jgi:hypothetical protein